MNVEQIINNILQFPLDSNDPKIICSILDNEYQEILANIKVMEISFKSFKFDMDVSIYNFNDSLYTQITKKISELEQIKTEINFVEPQKYIHADIVKNIKNFEISPKFFSVIPSSFINTIIETEFYLKQLDDDLVTIPSDIVSKTTKTLKDLKFQILTQTLSENYATIKPFFDFETFVISNGIIEIIDKLNSIEQCLLNSDMCNYNRTNFIKIETNLLWSQYYKEYFLFNNQYRLDMSKLTSNKTTISRFNEILKRVKRFIDHF